MSALQRLLERFQGVRSKSHDDPDSKVEINPARGTLFAVADEHVPQDRPPGLTESEWIIFRHLKSDSKQGLGKAGDISAKYFVDLREASLIPSQCEVLAGLLCSHIRESIKVENHHAVIIPKSGNTLLGMAVAKELGLAPVLVRDWPFYGRWIETLIASGRGIVVDDVSAQGETLMEATIHARDAGFLVNRAFLLISRGEGSAREILESNRLSLSSAFSMTDVEFGDLVDRVRRASNQQSN